MDFKGNIKFILQAKGMTQGDLAKKLGVTEQNVGYYLRGNITMANLQKIAEALDTTVETLVSETPLAAKDGVIPRGTKTTVTTLICPHCGKDITLVAK
jgi:transcriptional regulator with XRE-family HTH domain